MTTHNLCTRAVEFRAAEDFEGDGKTLEGYAAVFDQPTEINSWEGKFTERIAPGAFRKTISERKPVMQFDHGRDARTGTVPIGKFLELREDDKGLYVQARLFDNPVVEPVRQAIEGGAITGMSFRFKVNRDEWRDKDGNLVRSEELGRLLYEPGTRGPLQRTLKEVQLFEAGPVVNPAYEQTSVGVRSLTDDEREQLIAEYARTAVGNEEEHQTVDDYEDERAAAAAAKKKRPGDADNNADDMPGKKKPGDNSSDSKGTDNGDSKPRPKTSSDGGNSDGGDGKGDGKAPYGDVTYADPGYQKDGKKRYPIDTKDHVKAAWSYINKEHNGAQYSSSQLASIKSKIKAAAKKFGVDISSDNNSDSSPAKKAASPAKKTPQKAGAYSNNLDDAAHRGTSSDDNYSRKAEKTMPKNIDELRTRLDEISERMSEIGEEFRSSVLPEDVDAEWDDLTNERNAVEADIRAIEERAEVVRSLAGSRRTVEKGSDRGAPAFHRGHSEDIYDVEALRSSAHSNDDFRERLYDNAMRAVEKGRYSSVVRKAEAQENIERLLNDIDNEKGELAQRLLVTGSRVYERAFSKTLKALNTNGLTAEESRAMSLGTDAAGGFAVPFQLDPSVILSNDGAINPLRQLARVEQITGKEWQGVTSAGITVSRDAEAAEVSDDSPTLAQPTVKAERVQGFVPFSIELDMDWTQFRGEVSRMLQDARDREEATSFVTGSGVSPAANGVVATLTGNTVTSAGVAAFAAADVYALEDNLGPRWRQNASFLASKTYYNKIRQFDTAGGAQLWERIGAGQPPELLGYRALESSAMSTSFATGQKGVLFGDFKQFLIVDRVGMTVELVPHLFATANNRPTGQRGIYAIWRNNSKILVDAAFKLLVIQ